jgi:hypothetical protein
MLRLLSVARNPIYLPSILNWVFRTAIQDCCHNLHCWKCYDIKTISKHQSAKKHKTPPLLTRNGVFVFISQHPLWLGLTDYVGSCKGSIRNLLICQGFVGGETVSAVDLGTSNSLCGLREIRGRGHFFSSPASFFVCREKICRHRPQTSLETPKSKRSEPSSNKVCGRA